MSSNLGNISQDRLKKVVKQIVGGQYVRKTGTSQTQAARSY